MVVDAAVLVVDDEQGCVGPEFGVVADGVVDGGDELLAGADVVVGMLVAGDEFAHAVGCVVIGVVGLDEGVLGELVAAGGVEEVLEGSEEGGLILEQVDDFEGGAGLVVVVEARGAVASFAEALVDALELFVPVEDVHADLAERSAVVGEGAIAESRAGDGGEPAIEDRVLGGECGEDGEFFGREVVHDEVRVLRRCAAD